MALLSFEQGDFSEVSEALDIAEDATGNFFKFSLGQWKRHRYEVRTLASLSQDEISHQAFALLSRRLRQGGGGMTTKERCDMYFICLQDHQILRALKRDKGLRLLALLVYIFTHELVHIVRFCNFFQRFVVSEKERASEERIVHEITFEILDSLSVQKLTYVLDSYRGHRICDMAFS